MRGETAKRKGPVKTRFGLIQTRGRRLSKALEKCLKLFPRGESDSESEYSTDAIVVEFVLPHSKLLQFFSQHAPVLFEIKNDVSKAAIFILCHMESCDKKLCFTLQQDFYCKNMCRALINWYAHKTIIISSQRNSVLVPPQVSHILP